jgi:lauroyl/myristoyl acyltransferase
LQTAALVVVAVVEKIVEETEADSVTVIVLSVHAANIELILRLLKPRGISLLAPKSLSSLSSPAT